MCAFVILPQYYDFSMLWLPWKLAVDTISPQDLLHFVWTEKLETLCFHLLYNIWKIKRK